MVFPQVCAATIAQRNHFFCLKQQNKSSTLKTMFRQASDHCKSVRSAKLDHDNITRESITS